MGAIRDVILIRDGHLFSGIGALFVAAFVANAALGRLQFGFSLQPIGHSQHLWNFLGMVLAGLAFVLAGGCPGRQLFLSGEGDGDATVFVFGMIAGAAFAHNFGLAGGPDSLVDGTVAVGGIGASGIAAVLTGLVVCLVLGLTMKEKQA